jgi:hypothetical protein
VSSAASFFAVTVFNLSGAINVLLLLIVRPQLLLFPHPEDSSEPEAVVFSQPTTGSALFFDSARGHGHTASPQSTGMELGDDGDPPLNGNNVAVTLSRIESERSDGSI